MSKTETQTESQTPAEELGKLVSEYFEEHKESPFKHFEVKEDDKMAVDLDAEFEKTLTEKFGDKTSETLSEYISAVIKNLIDNLDEDELKELNEELEETEQEA